MKPSRTLVVGVGSPHGDDQTGWIIAELLTKELESSEAVVRRAKAPVELFDWIDDFERLVICDACQGLGSVGDVGHWKWPAEELVAAGWSGTHDLPLPVILQLADRLGRLPPRVDIWSIEGAVAKPLTGLSPELQASVSTVVRQIYADIVRDQTCTSNHSSEHC